jgi:Outer membrane lipoprotein-sorting protein
MSLQTCVREQASFRWQRRLGAVRVCFLCFPVILAMAMSAGCSKLSDAEKAAVPIVARNVIARGGLEEWRAVKSMRMSGQMDAGKVRSVDDVRAAMEPRPAGVSVRTAVFERLKNRDRQGKTVQLPFVMEMERPRKMRLEIVFQGQTAIQVYDGSRGWKLRPFLNRHEVEDFTAEELREASEEQELDGPLIDYDRKGSRVELQGTEPVEGRDAYKLKVTLKNGQVRHVWVDKESYLDVKIDGTRRMDGKLRPTSTYLRDYKSVNGLMIPFVMETSVEGVSGSHKIVVEKVAVNNPIDETRFEKPQ